MKTSYLVRFELTLSSRMQLYFNGS